MVVETHPDLRMQLYHNTPRGYRDNIRARGVIPHIIMSHRSRMAGMDQITKRLSCLDQWLVLQIHLMNPNRSTCGDMRWGWASQGYYPKVMPRSDQGHGKVKSALNSLFVFVLFQFSSLEMSMVVKPHLDPSMEISNRVNMRTRGVIPH